MTAAASGASVPVRPLAVTMTTAATQAAATNDAAVATTRCTIGKAKLARTRSWRRDTRGQRLEPSDVCLLLEGLLGFHHILARLSVTKT